MTCHLFNSRFDAGGARPEIYVIPIAVCAMLRSVFVEFALRQGGSNALIVCIRVFEQMFHSNITSDQIHRVST